jgi:alpha-D-xyloside xylohydrolase
MLSGQDSRIVYKYDAEQLRVEPWGLNAVRIRATKTSSMPTENWALLAPASTDTHPEISDEVATW